MTDDDDADRDGQSSLRASGRSPRLPEATERLSHGTPTFFVRGKTFVYAWLDGHHDNAFPHLWCAAAPGVQDARDVGAVALFRPPYVGHRGWYGSVDWDEIAEVGEDAYRAVAPKRLVAGLEGAPPAP